MYLALVTLFSVTLASAAGAAGLGIAAFALLGDWLDLAAVRGAAGRPFGRGEQHRRGGAAGPLGWPIATALVITVGAVTTAAALFSRQEL